MFKGLGGLGDMAGMMKKAQEMQAKEVAEDLILAAIKDAQAKATERSEREMRELTESLGLPPGMGLPG